MEYKNIQLRTNCLFLKNYFFPIILGSPGIVTNEFPLPLFILGMDEVRTCQVVQMSKLLLFNLVRSPNKSTVLLSISTHISNLPNKESG